jgi:hypothetical protein
MVYVSLSSRLPRSGNAALTSAAVIQAVIGTEFVLAGLSKAVDAEYARHFAGFVQASPGASHGALAGVVQLLVVPHLETVAELSKLTELFAGAVLIITALDVLRRRLAGPLGAQHGYEPLLALISAGAAFILGGMSLSIYVLEGGRLPGVNPGFAFGSPIAVELLLVPLALGIAWLEVARFVALRANRRARVATGYVGPPLPARRRRPAAQRNFVRSG